MQFDNTWRHKDVHTDFLIGSWPPEFRKFYNNVNSRNNLLGQTNRLHYLRDSELRHVRDQFLAIIQLFKQTSTSDFSAHITVHVLLAVVSKLSLVSFWKVDQQLDSFFGHSWSQVKHLSWDWYLSCFKQRHEVGFLQLTSYNLSHLLHNVFYLEDWNDSLLPVNTWNKLVRAFLLWMSARLIRLSLKSSKRESSYFLFVGVRVAIKF